MSNTKVVDWSEIADAAILAFQSSSVTQKSEALDWTWQAWKILIQAGLATYSSETERCEVAIRFMALVGLCLEACNGYFDWEEYVESECLEWAEYSNLSASHIKQRFSVSTLVVAVTLKSYSYITVGQTQKQRHLF